jgi:hypothetical protein
MKRASGLIGLASLVTLSLTRGSQTAFADVTSDQCIAANANAQSLRRESKLSAARDQLTICVNAHCPGMVRDDCARRLDDLDRLQPTIVFDAKDASGGDVIAVKVTVDGRPLTDKLDGSPLSLDPGPHTFSFAVTGQPPVTRRFVLKEGEKGRIEHVVVAALPSASTSASSQQSANSSAAETPSGGTGPRKSFAMALGATGVAGIAVGSVFGLMAQSQFNDQKSECSVAYCPGPQHSQALTHHADSLRDGTISTIGFIAGGAVLAGAAVLFFTGPSSDGRGDRAQRLAVFPSFAPTLVTLNAQGEF